MRKLVGIIGLVGLLVVLAIPAQAVLADNDLHDEDQVLAEADSCAGCHRAHTAQAGKLLKAGPGQDDFCFTCHGVGTPGAYTNVKDGVLLAGSPYGVGTDGDGNPLKGGGFENAVIFNAQDIKNACKCALRSPAT